jgi:hypothetical protein
VEYRCSLQNLRALARELGRNVCSSYFVPGRPSEFSELLRRGLWDDATRAAILAGERVMHDADHLTQLRLVAHHKSGEHASWAVLAALCCPRAHHTTETRLGYELGRCLGRNTTCAHRGIDLYFNGLRPPMPTFHARKTFVHFIRHPISMVVSGYSYHRRCPEHWTQDRGLLSSAPKSEATLFLGYERDRRVIEHMLVIGGAAPGLSYCEMLHDCNESLGVAAEASRAMVAGDGLRRLLIDRLRLRLGTATQHSLHDERLDFGPRMRNPKRPLGSLIEVCLEDVTPPQSTRARSTWRWLSARLGVGTDAFVPSLMGRSHEGHRSYTSCATKARLARLARAALRPHLPWLARLHGYTDAPSMAEELLRSRVGARPAGAALPATLEHPRSVATTAATAHGGAVEAVDAAADHFDWLWDAVLPCRSEDADELACEHAARRHLAGTPTSAQRFIF